MITTLTVLDLGASFMSLAGPAFHWLWDNKIWFFVLIVTHSIGRATDEINDRVSKLQAKIEQLECGEAYRAGDS